MRSIAKGAEPRALIQWKSDNASTPENLTYGGGGFPSEEVRQSLLREQFHLCAYTMKRLLTSTECASKDMDTRASCHIEHILPQARRVPGEDIDYKNMVACFPPSQSKMACEFGAWAKGATDPEEHPFVSPLTPAAQDNFSFNRQGEIKGTTPAGESTVKILNLNHKALVNDRAAVIKGTLWPKGKPLTASAARRLATRVLQPDANQCLSPYCTAVASAALAFADKEDARAARLRREASSGKTSSR